MQPQHLGLELRQRQRGRISEEEKGNLQALDELLPMPSLMLEGFGAENQTLLTSPVPGCAEAGSGVSSPHRTI